MRRDTGPKCIAGQDTGLENMWGSCWHAQGAHTRCSTFRPASKEKGQRFHAGPVQSTIFRRKSSMQNPALCKGRFYPLERFCPNLFWSGLPLLSLQGGRHCPVRRRSRWLRARLRRPARPRAGQLLPPSRYRSAGHRVLAFRQTLESSESTYLDFRRTSCRPGH